MNLSFILNIGLRQGYGQMALDSPRQVVETVLGKVPNLRAPRDIG